MVGGKHECTEATSQPATNRAQDESIHAPPAYAPESPDAAEQPPPAYSTSAYMRSLREGDPQEKIDGSAGKVKRRTVNVRQMTRDCYLKHYAKDDGGNYVGTEKMLPDAGLVLVPSKSTEDDVLQQLHELVAVKHSQRDLHSQKILRIEALFVLDYTFGTLPFSLAKTIDVAWDLFVGRGAQLIVAWTSYVIFSTAVLRVIERHPTSYRNFLHITLDGPSLLSIWTLLKDLFRTQSRWTGVLFFYMIVSILYVLCLPVILSAMTGYDSTTISWVNVEDRDRIIPASAFNQGRMVYSAGNLTFPTPTCSASSEIEAVGDDLYYRSNFCSCQLPNGTLLDFREWVDAYEDKNAAWDYTECDATVVTTVPISNQTFEFKDINDTYGYCYEDAGYTYEKLVSKVRCLPDTVHPSYSWGFSTMLSIIFVILQCAWNLTVYAVWQDAQWKSELVRGGYKMIQLCAVFALATAARWETGLGNAELVSADTKELGEELFGSKRKMMKGAMISSKIFHGAVEQPGGDEVMLKKRGVRVQVGEL
ncbi:hypothetical protein K458DRAFT_431090 [Lentithecium fluviatile CBS 122367]|uniref:Uncharacterized protein n=1 Tax=Lentithecium fluviatile CBS 122367 TaxID=1168545 RepID=A0A6G1J2P4_9PLEO|nr:hypothetical protein K458DRAFT_431090 [Lentithecium fluviatile CBS 122367]